MEEYSDIPDTPFVDIGGLLAQLTFRLVQQALIVAGNQTIAELREGRKTFSVPRSEMNLLVEAYDQSRAAIVRGDSFVYLIEPAYNIVCDRAGQHQAKVPPEGNQ